MSDGTRILLVEDDPALAREIIRALRREQWAIDHVFSLADAFEAVIRNNYRLVLLDRRLPDGDGLAVLAVARSRPSPPAVIFLTARDEVADRIEGLDAGADDYLIKPFAVEEFLARIRAAWRRTSAGTVSELIDAGNLSFDLASRSAQVAGKPFVLRRRELALLEMLLRRVGQVVQRAYLEEELYGFDEDVSTNALETQISRLRRRLDEADAGLELRTIRGVGYLLRPC